MNFSDETTILLSRKKILLRMIGAVAFAAAGIWMFNSDDVAIVAHRDPVYVHAVGLITAVFFGSLGIAGVGKLFARGSGLKLSEAGIHSSAVAAGFVPWSDVTGTRIY